MSTTTITTIPYTGSVQTATVTSAYAVPVTAHIWGAGGGSTAATALQQFFNTRAAVGSVPTVPSSNGAYCSFLNTYGVWIDPISAPNFDVTYNVNFPETGIYTFEGSTDNYGNVYLDGTDILYMPGFTSSFTADVYVTAGTHKIRIIAVNTGGPGSTGVTISKIVASGSGGGGGYSRVNFVAKPGDKLLVAVGQGGGAGGVTQLPPPPAKTWTTRDPGPYYGTVVYPAYQFPISGFLNEYGVWNAPPNVRVTGGSVDTTWYSVYFPTTGYYTVTGAASGTGWTYPNPNNRVGTLSIDGVATLTCGPGGYLNSQKVWVTAGYHSINVVADAGGGGYGRISSIAFTVEIANPSRIPNAPAGIPGASYIALLFNSRYPPTGQADPVYAYGNGDSFLDQWGVWASDQNDPTFAREYTINFPGTANVIFQMVANSYGRVYLDGILIVEGSGWQTNTVNQAIINVTAGNHILRIEGDGLPSGSTNRIGVTLGTGDQTSYSGGRGGISDPTSIQGFGGGGGGATILSLNGVVIGVGAGGGGGASAAPSNITYLTTSYTGSLSTQPFNVPGCTTTIAPGTSGYYVFGYVNYDGANEGQPGRFNAYTWCVVVNGVIVYGATQPPPITTAQPTQFVGYSCYDPLGQYNDFPAVECFSFNYTAVNTGAITNALFNGQNGQDEYNFNTPDTGGGGGGGGGARGGNGGSARGFGGGGYSGHNGLSLGTAIVPATGRSPYTNAYYPGGNVGVGAAGSTPAAGGNGCIVLEYQTGGGGAVYDNGEWKPIQTIYVKDSGIWKQVQTTYINNGGTWTPIQGATVPTFAPINVAFGALTRAYSAGSLLAPPPPAPDYTPQSTTTYGDNFNW